jgi:hypothetical protein
MEAGALRKVPLATLLQVQDAPLKVTPGPTNWLTRALASLLGETSIWAEAKLAEAVKIKKANEGTWCKRSFIAEKYVFPA